MLVDLVQDVYVVTSVVALCNVFACHGTAQRSAEALSSVPCCNLLTCLELIGQLHVPKLS